MRILIVSDAWYPQRNGVIRVLESLIEALEKRGHVLGMITPNRFTTIPCPSYSEIPLALFPYRGVKRQIQAFAPQALHIATEGPLGSAARRWCLNHKVPFTTAYHTKFPEYIHERTKLPLNWLYAGIRRFHKPAHTVMAPSPSVYRELTARNFPHVQPWAHGVNVEVFTPQPKDFLQLPRPIHMFVGRIAVEKNIPAFLDLELPGSKVVVGRGPQKNTLQKHYPHVHFFDTNNDTELVQLFSSADVFVFPSLTDTFGLVMLEAMACGVPVAAYPVTGPLDVMQLDGPGENAMGCLDFDLTLAIQKALGKSPAACRAYAMNFSWERVADQFLAFLAPIETRDALPAPLTAEEVEGS
ncbi:glycosyl transferase, group 1 [Magnetococcus marinus MC-1]|uniref:Glycosyl transferase, group 1 n=1 Tax=Magnetococcus marinus (strain ATCC BAA-1437 / JCM 17883 / MC-1) TaxID=156889 RepID=A0LDV1_MAGMM|nr:glycosyltransferase family 1 protein [Magnetococcus marinus]ABK46144.1 glycosyl transferase, group 1 [Magnetococcus marinus MC-1]